MWVPVRPKLSRRRWTSSSRGSTSASRASPLTVSVTCCVRHRLLLSLHAAGALDGLAERPDGHLRDHRALVVGRAADVGGRLGSGAAAASPARADRAPRSGAWPTASGSASVAANGVSARRRSRRCRRRSIRPSSPSAHGRRRRRPSRSRRPAARACCSRRPVARPARDADLGQDLGRLDRGRERVEEEVAGRDRRARRPRPGQTIVASDGEQHGRPVGRRDRRGRTSRRSCPSCGPAGRRCRRRSRSTIG